MFKVLRNGLLRCKLYTCPNLWCNPCLKCYGMDCFGTYFTHVQTCGFVFEKEALRAPTTIRNVVIWVLWGGIATGSFFCFLVFCRENPCCFREIHAGESRILMNTGESQIQRCIDQRWLDNPCCPGTSHVSNCVMSWGWEFCLSFWDYNGSLGNGISSLTKQDLMRWDLPLRDDVPVLVFEMHPHIIFIDSSLISYL